MRTLTLVAAGLALFVASCDSKTPVEATQADQKVVEDPNAPLGQLPDTATPVRYRLDLTVRPDQPRYNGVVEIDVNLKAPARIIYLHSQEHDVEKVTAKTGQTITDGKYQEVHKSGVARLTFDHDLPRGVSTLRIQYSSAFPSDPDALTVMPDSGEKYAWTQFESISARRAFPSFDEPRFKTPFQITLRTRATDAAITNTMPATENAAADGMKTTVFSPTEPLPTYLVAMAVGPYDVVTGKPVPATKLRTAPLPLRAITVKGKGDRTAYALANTAPLINYFEDYFATAFPYPKLDLVAPPNFTPGGMENAGMITYTERGILLDGNASTQQKRYFTSLHAHEIAHQWFGDLVTPKWWNDIWLNESFASWMAIKASNAVWREGEFARRAVVSALEVMDTDSLSSARSVRQPIKSNDDIANAFDGLTYDKGAGVLTMFESYIGADKFRDGVRIHMQRYADGVADARDFMQSLADGSQRPEIIPAFESFLNQPGVPLLRVKSTCAGKDLNVELTQSANGAKDPADKRLWQIPVCMRNIGKARTSTCSMLTERTSTVTLKGECNAVVLPNVEGAGYYRFTMAQEDWSKLTAQMPKMTPAEQMSLLDSVRNAFRAGETDASTYLTTLKTAGTTGPWDLVHQVQTYLAEIRGSLDKADVAAFDQTTRTWFTPAIKKLGLEPRKGEPPSQALLRVEIAETMVKVARDPATISALAAKGANYLQAAIQNQQPAGGVSREMLPIALWAAVFTGGEQVAHDATIAIKASSDAEFRNGAIKALAAARNDKAIAEINEFVTSGALRVREFRFYLGDIFGDPERKTAAWAWLRKDFERIAKDIPKENRSRFVGLPSSLCSEAATKEIDWFFKPMIGDMLGAPRVFANTMEKVNRCIAWRKTTVPALAAVVREH